MNSVERIADRKEKTEINNIGNIISYLIKWLRKGRIEVKKQDSIQKIQ